MLLQFLKKVKEFLLENMTLKEKIRIMRETLVVQKIFTLEDIHKDIKILMKVANLIIIDL